jgi:hypothetical protein
MKLSEIFEGDRYDRRSRNHADRKNERHNRNRNIAGGAG